LPDRRGLRGEEVIAHSMRVHAQENDEWLERYYQEAPAK
jgi:hypothetical protein